MDEARLFAFSDFVSSIEQLVRQSSTRLFRRKTLNCLSEKIGFDGAIWGEAHVTDKMTLHEPEIIGLPSNDLSSLQEAAYSDPHMKFVLDQPGVPVSYSVKPSAPGALVAYSKRNNVAHVMSTAQFDIQLGLASGLVLTRNGSRFPFDSEDRAFMHATFRHLIRSWSENQIFHLRNKVEKARRKTVYAAVSRAGNINGAEQGFFPILKREFSDFSGPHLPNAVQRILTFGDNMPFIGKKIVIRCYRSKDLSLLVVRDRLPADELTPKQLAVAKLCADGFTYRDIADRLSIAPSTARNHIAAIHERLGVVRNSEIARRLDEAMW